MFSVTNTELKNFAVMNQESVPHEVRGHHRAARPGLDRLLHARAIHLVDLLEKMRLDEGPFFNDLPINLIYFFCFGARRMKRSLGFVLRARLEAFRQLAPRTDIGWWRPPPPFDLP